MNNKFARKQFREAWIGARVKRGLATQLRAMRGDLTQTAFGKQISKPQSVIARLEDPNYGAMSIQTLLDIAAKLDVGLLVRFVRFSRALEEERQLSLDDLAPISYESEMKVLSANFHSLSAEQEGQAILDRLNDETDKTNKSSMLQPWKETLLPNMLVKTNEKGTSDKDEGKEKGKSKSELGAPNSELGTASGALNKGIGHEAAVD